MRKSKFLFWIFAAAIIFLGIFWRFWQLEKIPPGIHYDEAYNGLDAIAANESGEYKVFYPGNDGREGLHINAQAFFIKIFGVSSFSLRLASAFWGSLTILGFFLLLRRLKFSSGAVLAGTFALAFSFWHLDFSRTAYRAIMVPLICVWTLYFLIRALTEEKNRRLNFILAGAMLGLGFYTYISFRAFPLAIAIFLGVFFLFRKEMFKKFLPDLFLFIFSSVLTALPLAIYFFNHQADFLLRTKEASIFNDPDNFWASSLFQSALAHLGAFFDKGDANPRFNFNQQPLLPIGWQVFFFAGFFLSVRNIFFGFRNFFQKKKETNGCSSETSAEFQFSFLAQIVFWTMLLPGIFSRESIPHSLRIIGAIPAVFILLAVPFEYLARRFFSPSILKKYFVPLFLFLAIFIFSGFLQIHTYFYLWAKDPRTLGGFEKKITDYGLLIRQIPPAKKNYLILTPNAHISADHKNSSFKTAEYIAYQRIRKYFFYAPPGPENPNCDSFLAIIFEEDEALRRSFLQKCPGARETYEVPKDGIYGFWVIRK